MMKYKIISTAVFLMVFLLANTARILGQDETYMEKIENIRIAFFTERLDLTSGEAEKFWPVYKDYNNRQEKINEDRRILFRYVTRNSDFLTEKEISESLDKYIRLQKEETILAEQYNNKFLEILPAKKVMKIYVIENQFKAYILNQIRGNQRPFQPGARRPIR